MEKFDSTFGELCVKKGFVSFVQLKECIDIQNKLIEMGLEPKPLSEVLVEKKYLNKPQVEEVLKDISKDGAPAAETASSGGSKPAIRNEYEFGELAIKEGLITFEQLKECLDIQNKIRNLGYEPKPLDEILIDRKYLTRHQVDSLKSTGGKPKEPSSPRVESRLGDIAVKKRFISKEQLEECLILQARSRDPGQTPKKLGEILVEKGYITAEQLDELLIQSAKAPAPFEIPGYEIISKIGLGGMGAVYKARQVSIGREVAIKVLFPKYTKDREYMERFLREARLLAKMSHPNIVLAIDAGQVRGVPYFCMEYIDGISVSELLEHKGRLPERDCLKIGMHVARALQHAFKHKLVHRDIKPQNVMITKDGLVKVCDLGIAKRTDVKDDLHLTSEGMAIGTPYYMSPEAALGREVDIRADIYSLGATLYHLATGVAPFDSNSPAAILAMHVNEPLIPPKRRFTGLSDAFNDMVVKMMRKNPMERYQTPADAVQAMEDLLRHKPGTPASHAPVEEAPSNVLRDHHTKRVLHEAPAPKSSSALFAVLIFLGVLLLFALAYWLLADLFNTKPSTSHAPPPPEAPPPDRPPVKPPDGPPVAPTTPLQRENQTKIAEMNAFLERVAQEKPDDEFVIVYNEYTKNIVRFRGTEYYTYWTNARDGYMEKANQRADDLWVATYKSKAELHEQVGELKKAIEVLEGFPKGLRLVGPNMPSRAESERRQMLGALYKKSGASIEDYEKRARQAAADGQLAQAWELVLELELIGGEERAKLLRPQILEKQYAELTAPPLTRVKVEHAYTVLDMLSQQHGKAPDFQAEIARRRKQVDADFEAAFNKARVKFGAHHDGTLHPQFETAVKSRDYLKISRGAAAAFASPDYAPLLQTPDFDHATIARLAAKAPLTPDELSSLISSIELALGAPATAKEESIRELLLDLWTSVELRQLMLLASQGLLRLAAERKEQIGTLNHPHVAGGKDFRVKLVSQEGLSAEVTRVSPSTEIGGSLAFYPKKAGAWGEKDLERLAAVVRSDKDASFDVRIALLYAYSDKPADGSAAIKKAQSAIPAVQALLDRIKSKSK